MRLMFGCLALLVAVNAAAQVYRWTDEKGLTHFTDDEGRVPERYRAASKVRTLPLLTVYRGEYSRLPGPAAAVAPAMPRPSATGAGARAVVYSAAWCGARQKTQAFKVDGVPMLFVNGKYITSNSHANGNTARIMQIVDQLVVRARKETVAAK